MSDSIDLSFFNAATLLMPATERWRLIMVGCGGTGSWLAPSVARIASVLQEQGKEVVVEFIDPDLIEQKNIPRQNFSQAEIGENKATTLAFRYGSAWGLNITARPFGFTSAAFEHEYHSVVTIIIGCVDNAAARKQISECLKYNRAEQPHTVWWLDCGNAKVSGQVIVGSATSKNQLLGAFPSRKICTALPSPSLVAPELLKALAEETNDSKMSCAEIQMLNAQSLSVNQQVAAIATDYLLRMVMGGLKKSATYFDHESGAMRSTYINGEAGA